ncbi:ribosomal protection-like ABC-F family protein [Alicyclobacillus acidiphilus]|uniref:ribosomal protection-like ABC-F family protein n=1 Tax=Alicyclobacillus acidiphilus TaxID=182455 RepID=UPI00082CA6DB|nr:ABC-F type ribosomal protection protein [Alicyclobacillus acidiphilus]
MAFVIRVQDVAKEWEGKRLFEHISMDIAEGERVALFGANGIGKTTFIRGLMNDITFDSGKVWRRDPIAEWGWLRQQISVAQDSTLRAFVQSGQPGLDGIRKDMERLQRVLREMSSANLDQNVVAAYGEAMEQYIARNGYDWEVEVEQTLSRLGFRKDQCDTPYHLLSGGEKTRAQLARLIVSNPRFLILDEPTNHLDTETLEWLEDWLKQYQGAVLFVSHDRQFIDDVAHAVVELTANGMKRYVGGYTSFRAQRNLEIQSQTALYEKQVREKKHLLEAIRRYQQWYAQAHEAAGIDFHLRKKAEKNSTRLKAKEKALARLEREMVDRPQSGPSLRLDFADGELSAKTLIRFDEVAFGYGSTALFQHLSLDVRRGDKISVIGRNGTGKSTLLKLLTSRLAPNRGRVYQHPALQIGYFAQELDDLDLEQTVLDTILAMDGMTLSHARTVLAGFLFRQDDVFKRIADLSMGERCRVAFVKLYFSKANLLVLDEPTNYLDIDARERIEEALAARPGALLIVSHDRFLTKRIANRIWHLTRSPQACATTVQAFDGSYESWLARRSQSRDIPTHVHNQIHQLEYRLAQAVAAEVSSEIEQRALAAEISRISRVLAELKQQWEV